MTSNRIQNLTTLKKDIDDNIEALRVLIKQSNDLREVIKIEYEDLKNDPENKHKNKVLNAIAEVYQNLIQQIKALMKSSQSMLEVYSSLATSV